MNMRSLLIALTLFSSSMAMAYVQEPMTVQEFKQLLRLHPMAIVHFTSQIFDATNKLFNAVSALSQYQGKLAFIRMNVAAFPQLRQEYNLKAPSTLMLFKGGVPFIFMGREVMQSHLTTAAQIKDFIDSHFGTKLKKVKKITKKKRIIIHHPRPVIRYTPRVYYSPYPYWYRPGFSFGFGWGWPYW